MHAGGPRNPMPTNPPSLMLPQRPTPPQWPRLQPSMWKRPLQIKLSVSIPIIITSFVILSGLCEVYFISRILKSLPLSAQENLRLLPILQTATTVFTAILAATAIMAATVGYAITRPIHRLVQYARTLTATDFSQRFPVRSYDEFGILESAFNEMAQALQAYQRQMEEYNRTLEERVEARTEELSAVLGLSKSMLFILEKERLLKLIASHLHEATRYDLCAICLTTETGAEVFLRGTGRVEPALSQAFIDRIRQETARLGAPLPADDRLQLTISDEADHAAPPRPLQGPLAGFVVAPLQVGATTTGVMALGSLEAGRFDHHTANLLMIIANHVALAVESVKSYTRLKELDRLKSDFVSTVSHELRTPLTVIKEGHALLGEAKIGTLNPQQQELLSVIQDNSERLYQLISDLLDLSKLEAGKARFHKRPVRMADVAADTFKRFKIPANDKRLQCVDDIPADLPQVYADPHKLSQVLTNLVSNAIKYTPAGGAIRITARAVDDLVETCVWNAGTPLPEVELERIFEKFYQVGRTPGAGARGTGLGLTIVREIVQHHGGRVWAGSDPTGNRFLFTLPQLDRTLYLMDSLTELIDQAKARHTFCNVVYLCWANAETWRRQVGAGGIEPILVGAETACHALEQQGLADRIFRFGQEPGLIILTTTDLESATVLAVKAVAAVQQAAPRASGTPPLAFHWTTRIAVYPNDGHDATQLLQVVTGNARTRKSA